MDFRAYCGDMLRAVAFLSRIPVPGRFFEGRTGGVADWAHVFPLAGLLVAAPGTILLLLLGQFDADPLVAALLGLAAQTFVTGALHEDGLADSTDGLFGGRDRESALAIMKDSRIGSYGAAALFFSFALRAAALAALLRTVGPAAAAAGMLAIAATSRGAMVWHWSRLPSARTDGIAANAGSPGASTAFQSAALATAATIALASFGPGWAGTIAVLTATALSTAWIGRLARRKIGGHTGDTIGACQQLCETLGLAALALAA